MVHGSSLEGHVPWSWAVGYLAMGHGEFAKPLGNIEIEKTMEYLRLEHFLKSTPSKTLLEHMKKKGFLVINNIGILFGHDSIRRIPWLDNIKFPKPFSLKLLHFSIVL